MKVAGSDFRTLRWPLAVALVLIVSGIAVTVATERQLDDARQQREQARNARSAAQERVIKATDEEKQIRANLVEYGKMVDSGMVGRTNRLNLIERIADIKNGRKLFEMRYNIEAQKPLDYPGLTTTGALDLVTNRMSLDMLLLHENDFLNFLHDLNDSRQAYVSMRHCALTRNATPAPGSPVVPGLRSECIVDLVNLVEAQS